MFLPLDILFEYCIEYITFGLLYAILDSLLGYFLEEFKALQITANGVFVIVD